MIKKNFLLIAAFFSLLSHASFIALIGKQEKINQKVEISEEKFMSLDERENALAQLIIDMELLHIKTLK